MSSFNSEYNKSPFSAIILNDDDSVRCAIKQRKNAHLFVRAVGKAIFTELDVSVAKITIGDFNHKDYSTPVTVEYEDEFGEDSCEEFKLIIAAVY